MTRPWAALAAGAGVASAPCRRQQYLHPAHRRTHQHRARSCHLTRRAARSTSITRAQPVTQAHTHRLSQGTRNVVRGDYGVGASSGRCHNQCRVVPTAARGSITACAHTLLPRRHHESTGAYFVTHVAHGSQTAAHRRSRNRGQHLRRDAAGAGDVPKARRRCCHGWRLHRCLLPMRLPLVDPRRPGV